jgi:acyl-CoA thioesterase-1
MHTLSQKTIMKNLLILALLAISVSTNGLLAQSHFLENLNSGIHQTVVVYGTSLSASPNGWPAMLEKEIDKRYPSLVKVENMAAGAMWSTWGVKNLDERVLSKNPDLVLIEFAINDAFVPYKTSKRVCQLNLEYMIDRILEQNPKCDVVIQIMNMPTGIHFNEHRPDFESYNEVYRQVAKNRNLLLIDHTTYWKPILEKGLPEYLKLVPDGIHPEELAWRTLVTPYILKSLKIDGF